MLRLTCALLLLLYSSNNRVSFASTVAEKHTERPTGTLEKMIVASGDVTMDLDLNQLNCGVSATKESRKETLRFEVDPNSFFTVLVFNKILRGVQPGSMQLDPTNAVALSGLLQASVNQLILEKLPSNAFVVRDGKTGFVFFNIEGPLTEYDARSHLLSIKNGRLLISEKLANKLGQPANNGLIVGKISIALTMYPIEINTLSNGVVQSSILPVRSVRALYDPTVLPGPDVIVGDLPSVEQFGTTVGTQIGLAVGTTSCNNGTVPVDWFGLPDTDHPAIPQNLYRLSGKFDLTTFEQIGQSWVKHGFFALEDDECGFGCNTSGCSTGGQLCPGCSDTYEAGLNAFQDGLGSRAWVNPFTGNFPSNAADHTGHTHSDTTHRVLVEANDLNTIFQDFSSFYAEAQYISPHEYAWCQAHPGECNMYNNVSYRQFSVSGTTSFTFTPVGSTVRMAPAITAWSGATIIAIEPAPGVDGRAYLAYRVAQPPSPPGVWQYEYAIYNQNLDRSIQSFSVPLGCGITLLGSGFHAPPNHPGIANDGTLGDAGYSNAPWTLAQTVDAITWSTETFAQNQNANAIRWGTLYNFRFISNRPPQAANATIGFFKTGTQTTVAIQAPAPDVCTGTPTPTSTPSPSGTPTATATGTPSPVPTPTPTPPSGPLNLSTRILVQTGDNVAIGGFIITGNGSKNLVVRGIGPSLANVGIPNPLADPELELHTPGGSLVNDNWKNTQQAAIKATGLAPTNDLESAILATLDPGVYTAILRGKNNGTGVGLVQVFDLDSASTSRLANISTRALVGTGGNIVIAGFILGGSLTDNVIVRGLGPSLTLAGVPSVLDDPTLELRDSSGAIVRSNDDWEDDPDQVGIIRAAGLSLGNERESAVATTLSPGQYTALLAGKNNTTGNGLTEVYDLGHEEPFPSPTPSGTPAPSPSPSSTPSPTPILCTEDWDNSTAPALPPGWIATNPVPGDGTMWVTSTNLPESAPNAAFVPDQDGISDKVLDRVSVTITNASAVMGWRNNFDNEFSAGICWDGYVLEVSSPNINGGNFLDITDSLVGGSFVTGGYGCEIDGSANNPLAGRMAWGGTSGGYIDTVVNLGPNLAGQTATFRFRMGTDEAIGAPGVWIDNILVTNATCP